MNADNRRFEKEEKHQEKPRGIPGEQIGENLRSSAAGPAENRGFKNQEITKKIIGVFYEVYNELGHGFLESVYEQAMAIALAEAGLTANVQFPIAVYFRGRQVGDFKADILVNNAVLVELKAAKVLDSSHEAQLLNYLRATSIEVGLLLNFGPRPEFKRLAFDNERKQIRASLAADERRSSQI